MSKSGIPIVSQVAQAAVNTANSVGAIAQGGNVFENLGRIGASVTVANPTNFSNTASLAPKLDLPVISTAQNFSAKQQELLYDIKNPNVAMDAAKSGLKLAAQASAIAGVSNEFKDYQSGLNKLLNQFNKPQSQLQGAVYPDTNINQPEQTFVQNKSNAALYIVIGLFGVALTMYLVRKRK